MAAEVDDVAALGERDERAVVTVRSSVRAVDTAAAPVDRGGCAAAG